MSTESTGADPLALSADPPPYPWLDDPAQPFGPVPPMLAVAMGVLVGPLGAWMAVAGGLNATGGARAGTVVVGVILVLVGGQSVRMGLRRRAWRQRHPGVDPLEVARAQNANVGSALGNDSGFARAFRWVLVVVCAVVGLFALVALLVGLTGDRPATPVVLAVLAALVVLSGWLGWASLLRSLGGRRASPTGRR